MDFNLVFYSIYLRKTNILLFALMSVVTFLPDCVHEKHYRNRESVIFSKGVLGTVDSELHHASSKLINSA